MKTRMQTGDMLKHSKNATDTTTQWARHDISLYSIILFQPQLVNYQSVLHSPAAQSVKSWNLFSFELRSWKLQLSFKMHVNPLSCKIIGGKAVFAPSISKEITLTTSTKFWQYKSFFKIGRYLNVKVNKILSLHANTNIYALCIIVKCMYSHWHNWLLHIHNYEFIGNCVNIRIPTFWNTFK